MYFVKRSIIQPLRKVINAADTLAHGDLTIAQLEHNSKDEIGTLATAVNALKQNLSVLLKMFRTTLHNYLPLLKSFPLAR